MIDISAVFANFTGSGPLSYTGKNATGAGATDGTEFIAAMIDNWMWGWTQRLFTMAGVTPDGTTENSSASQIMDAFSLIFAPPGVVMEWNLSVDPSAIGARFLYLNGQGILRASYTDLDNNVWVGSGLNATASAYFRADDAAGTSRNTTGAYLILPESRGYATRGLDVAASVDPDGAGRDIGDLQEDSTEALYARMAYYGPGSKFGYDSVSVSAWNSDNELQAITSSAFVRSYSAGISVDPQGGSSETRMKNRATKFVIRY